MIYHACLDKPQTDYNYVREQYSTIGAKPKKRILTIYCWNEWTEGSYLEPDEVHGMAYLKAVKSVMYNLK